MGRRERLCLFHAFPAPLRWRTFCHATLPPPQSNGSTLLRSLSRNHPPTKPNLSYSYHRLLLRRSFSSASSPSHVGDDTVVRRHHVWICDEGWEDPLSKDLLQIEQQQQQHPPRRPRRRSAQQQQPTYEYHQHKGWVEVVEKVSKGPPLPPITEEELRFGRRIDPLLFHTQMKEAEVAEKEEDKGEGEDQSLTQRQKKECAWGHQFLQDCHVVEARSISALARKAVDKVLPSLLRTLPPPLPSTAAAASHQVAVVDAMEGHGSVGGIHAWCLHSFAPDTRTSPFYRRSKLIGEAFLEELKDRRKKLIRNLVPEGTSVLPGTTLVQLFLAEKNKLYVSCDRLSFCANLGWMRPLPWTAGCMPISPDPVPPSRAYRKIEEMARLITDPETQQRLMLAPGSYCVELGSAPGGMTKKLLDWGVRVVSVDRSPLHPKLMRHPNLVVHKQADGALWTPNRQVDTVLCDMLFAADRSSEVLLSWAKEKRCKNFIWTLKFTGKNQYETVLPKVREGLKRLGVPFVIRHLTNHGNELVVIGRVVVPPPRHYDLAEPDAPVALPLPKNDVFT
ncbi:FtsJ domain-containing protein [Balamuthia mandrillaris]